MIHLSNSQKEILIFLLLALVVILLISFISYVIWKQFCQQQLEEPRQNEGEDFEVACDDTFALREQPFRTSQGEHLPTISAAPRLYPALTTGDYQSLSTHASPSALNPSAPSLASFYSNSNVSTEASTLAESRERLPTYQEAVHQDE